MPARRNCECSRRRSLAVNEAALRVRAAGRPDVVDDHSESTREAKHASEAGCRAQTGSNAEAYANYPDSLSQFSIFCFVARRADPLQEILEDVVLSPDSDIIEALFGAVRAEGLGEVEMEGLDLEQLRELVPDVEVSPDLPDAERERLESETETEPEAEAGTN